MQTVIQPFDLLQKKIDVAYVCNEDGGELHSFGIKLLGKAEELADRMTRRHQQKYTVQIKNVPSVCAQAHIGGM